MTWVHAVDAVQRICEEVRDCAPVLPQITHHLRGVHHQGRDVAVGPGSRCLSPSDVAAIHPTWQRSSS